MKVIIDGVVLNWLQYVDDNELAVVKKANPGVNIDRDDEGNIVVSGLKDLPPNYDPSNSFDL